MAKIMKFVVLMGGGDDYGGNLVSNNEVLKERMCM